MQKLNWKNNLRNKNKNIKNGKSQKILAFFLLSLMVWSFTSAIFTPVELNSKNDNTLSQKKPFFRKETNGKKK